MAAITICSDFGAPKDKSLTLFPLFPHLFPMKWWDRMPWSSFSECWALSQFFHSPLSLSSRGELLILLLWTSVFLSLKWDTSYLLHKVTTKIKGLDAHKVINSSWHIESTQYMLTILLYHSLSTFVWNYILNPQGKAVSGLPLWPLVLTNFNKIQPLLL